MVGRGNPRFTAKPGQDLAFIYYYTKIHGRAPAEANLQEYFKVSGRANSSPSSSSLRGRRWPTEQRAVAHRAWYGPSILIH